MGVISCERDGSGFAIRISKLFRWSVAWSPSSREGLLFVLSKNFLFVCDSVPSAVKRLPGWITLFGLFLVVAGRVFVLCWWLLSV